MIEDLYDFETWFDIFIDHVHQLNYHGPIDRGTFMHHYNNDRNPEAVAEEFVAEMNG